MKKNKIALIAVVLSLVGIIAVGTTLAYLNTSTQTVTNTFTPSGSQLSIQLREPAWDGFDFDVADNDYKWGLEAKTNDPALGIKKAAKYAPGSVIPKDPTVKNTGNSEAWIAVKLTGTNVPAYASIAYNNTNAWTFVDKGNGVKIAYLNAPLAVNAKTAPVFTQITIDAAATDLGSANFNITATAYAIQTENIADLSAAQTAFASQFSDLA